MSMRSGQNINRLSHEHHMRLIDLLRFRGPKILEERPTLPALAAELSAALGFVVTPAGLGRARKLVGLDWEPRQKPRERKADALASRLEVLENSLYILFEQLGLGLPHFDPEKKEGAE
jgi:hypothetical protein